MSDTLPTKRVKASNEWGYMVINESDFDAAVHELVDDESAPEPVKLVSGETPKPADLTIAKGPRGKFYIYEGKARIGAPYDTEEAATAALEAAKAREV